MHHRLEPLLELLIHAKIVEAPTHILGSHPRAIAPPGIMPLALLKVTESIHVARLQETRHPGPLFGQIARVLLVALGIAKVDRLMSDIKIPANHDLLALVPELLKKAMHLSAKLELIAQARVLALTVGEVRIDERKLRVLGNQHAALAINRLYAHPGLDAEGFFF